MYIPTLTETVLLLEALDSSPITSSHIRQWTAKDSTLAKGRDCFEHPDEDVIKPFHRFWPELSTEQGCLLRGSTVVIPEKGRKFVVEKDVQVVQA